jgi:hypothetical protein
MFGLTVVFLYGWRRCKAVKQRGLLPKGEASAKGVSPMSDCTKPKGLSSDIAKTIGSKKYTTALFW